MTKPTSPLQSFRSRTEYLHSCSPSIAVAPDKRGGAHISEGVIFCNRKRELWSGNESGSSVVGTSALSPGVLCQMYIMLFTVQCTYKYERLGTIPGARVHQYNFVLWDMRARYVPRRSYSYNISGLCTYIICT